MRQVPTSILKLTATSRRPLTRVFLLSFNAQFGFHLLSPLLTFVFFSVNSPLFDAFTAVTKRSLLYGFCLSLSSIGNLIANAIMPAMSDFYGRKLAWIISLSALFFIALFSLLGLFLRNPNIFILGFFLHGLLDANKSTGLVCVAEQSHKHNLVTNMGILQSMVALGACLGPVIGGFLAEKFFLLNIPYTFPFLLTLIISFIGLSQAAKFQNKYQISNNKKIETIAINQQDKIFNLFFVLILSQLSWSTYYQFIGPFLKTTYHFSATKIGFFMGGIALWLVLAGSIVLRFLNHYFTDRQIIIGSVISVAIGITITLSVILLPFNMPMLFWISAIPISMGDVILYSLLVSRLSNSIAIAHRSKVLGLSLIVALSVWSFTALLCGYLMSLNILGAFYFMPIGIFILLIFIRILIPERRNK